MDSHEFRHRPGRFFCYKSFSEPGHGFSAHQDFSPSVRPVPKQEGRDIDDIAASLFRYRAHGTKKMPDFIKTYIKEEVEGIGGNVVKDWVDTQVSNEEIEMGSVIYMPSVKKFVLMPKRGTTYYTFSPSEWRD